MVGPIHPGASAGRVAAAAARTYNFQTVQLKKLANPKLAPNIKVHILTILNGKFSGGACPIPAAELKDALSLFQELEQQGKTSGNTALENAAAAAYMNTKQFLPATPKSGSGTSAPPISASIRVSVPGFTDGDTTLHKSGAAAPPPAAAAPKTGDGDSSKGTSFVHPLPPPPIAGTALKTSGAPSPSAPPPLPPARPAVLPDNVPLPPRTIKDLKALGIYEMLANHGSADNVLFAGPADRLMLEIGNFSSLDLKAEEIPVYITRLGIQMQKNKDNNEVVSACADTIDKLIKMV